MLMLTSPPSKVNAIRISLNHTLKSYTFIGTYFASGYCAGYFCGAVLHYMANVNTPGPIGVYLNNILGDVGLYFSAFDKVETDDVISIIDVFRED